MFHVQHPAARVEFAKPTRLKTLESNQISTVQDESPMNRLIPASSLVPVQSFITRRRALQGALALAASTALPGCGSSMSNSGGTTPPPTGNPQPTPTGPITQASLSVSATGAGLIGSAFAGLSYEKSTLYENPYLFTGSNSDLIGLFQRLGPSVLRIGGNSVDRNVWTPAGAGQTAGQIAPSDVNALAAFVKAAGWQCLYGIRLYRHIASR